MDAEQFREGAIEKLEKVQDRLVERKPLSHKDLTDIRNSLNTLAENAQTVRDNLPQ